MLCVSTRVIEINDLDIYKVILSPSALLGRLYARSLLCSWWSVELCGMELTESVFFVISLGKNIIYYCPVHTPRLASLLSSMLAITPLIKQGPHHLHLLTVKLILNLELYLRRNIRQKSYQANFIPPHWPVIGLIGSNISWYYIFMYCVTIWCHHLSFFDAGMRVCKALGDL